MAESAPKRLLYLAFNRSVKEEAERKFPKNVEVKTLHGLAFGRVVKGKGAMEAKFRAGEGQVRPYHVLEALNLRDPILALVIRDTLGRFIRSGEARPKEEHIPVEYRAKRKLLDPKRWANEAKFILRATKRLWKKMKDPEDPFPVSHDGYVRIWVEGGGNLKGWDGVLVDEAQDLDPLFLGLLERHKGLLQRVYVGDPRQQIYGWRGSGERHGTASTLPPRPSPGASASATPWARRCAFSPPGPQEALSPWWARPLGRRGWTSVYPSSPSPSSPGPTWER
jgi:ATP-dependent exoDNAse (exonuclease V) beta subunit (contains helicase and exonuclease domains)